MNDNKTPECADLIAALRTAANGGLILTGKAAGVIVNPRCLEYAADLLEQLISLQSENAKLREENGCLQHNVAAMEATLDQQAKNCEVLLAEKDREIERLKAELLEAREDYMASEMGREQGVEAIVRVEAERDAAKKCIYDIETYLAFGSAQYIGRTIQAWKSGAQGEG